PAPVEPADGAPSGSEPGVVPLPLSGKSPEALRDQAERLLLTLSEGPGSRPLDLGYSLATTRSAFDHRAVVLATDHADAVRALTAIAAGAPDAAAVVGRTRTGRHAILFSGQGSQRLGMGRGLYGRFPVFAGALDEVVDGLDAELPGQV
ncbi:hypothetical protein LVX13_39140, partial [Streptomyces albulus]